jgi:glycosyltransferase involved in cell wall biosynthesis
MANSLAKKGHKIWIITHKIENENYENFHKNITINFASSIRYEGGLPPTINENMKFIFSAFFQGLKIIKREKIDLIHSNNFSPAVAASLISSFTKCPHITAMWDVFSLCGKDFWLKWSEQKNVSRFHAFLGKRFEKLILSLRHDAIHTISDASKEDLLKFGAKKPIYVIPPAIETSEINPNKSNPLQFIYVGRLVFYKNIDTIIHSISIVKKQFADVKLIIIGGGPQRQELMELSRKLDLKNNIEFRGYVSEEEKNSTLSSSIAMLFPSLCEGFGLVILESFMFEKPVLVSDSRPLSDIVENNVDGYVIEAKDQKKWAEKIIDVIQNPESAKKIGYAGKQKALNCYSLDNMITNIESMYKSIKAHD